MKVLGKRLQSTFLSSETYGHAACFSGGVSRPLKDNFVQAAKSGYGEDGLAYDS